MASVTVYTAAKIDELIDVDVVNASFTGGHLILQLRDGSTIDIGSLVANVPDSSTTVKGVVELATDTETITGTDTTRAVTPFGLASLSADDVTKGLVELATDAEAIAQTGTHRAVTPANLAAVVATATARGLVELATTAEATTGTDTTRAVTPAGLKTVADTKQPLDSDLTAIAGLVSSDKDFLQYTSTAWASRTPSQAAATLNAVSMPYVYYYSGSYGTVNGPAIYVGPNDPGSVANGSVWLDTTGT